MVVELFWGSTTTPIVGNDATDRPIYPAAFAPHPGGPSDEPGIGQHLDEADVRAMAVYLKSLPQQDAAAAPYKRSEAPEAVAQLAAGAAGAHPGAAGLLAIEPLDAAAGHIPGAVNRFFQHNLLPDGRFKPAAQLREEYAALLQGQDASRTVMQCGSGVTACHDVLAMEAAGLGTPVLYPGSWSEWSADPSRPVARGD